MNISKITESFNKFHYLIFLLVFIISSFGRNFTGIYIGKFRIGEIIVGLLVIFTHFLAFKKRGNFANFYALFIILFYFKLLMLYGQEIELNIFRFSSIIWLIACLDLARSFQKDHKMLAITLFSSLLFSYYINYVSYPIFLKNFFINYSDNFDYSKPSDLFLLFSTYLFLIYKFFSKKMFLINLIFFSFLYLPIFYYQSRGALLAYIVLILIYILNFLSFRFQLNLNKIIFYLFFLFCVGITAYIIQLENVYYEKKAISLNVFSAEVEIKNIPSDFLYFDNKYLVSNDENINWRIQIWQTTLYDMIDDKVLVLGNNLNNSIPIMNHPYYKTIYLNNYNLHNFLIQFFAYFGIFGLIIYFLLFKKIVLNYSDKYKNLNILVYILPVFVVSFFDSSMESVRFPFLFYFILGYFTNNNT